MKKLICWILTMSVILPFAACPASAGEYYPPVVNVAEFVEPNSGKDVYAELQELIDSNPNRTIWFPDGEYIVSHSLCTPADPEKSVELRLADFAVIKAAPDFEGEAVVRLGGKDAFNTTWTNGSNYSLIGGIIDGNNIANGVSIDSGRETKIQNTSIKHTVVGLHIKYGANSGSSDADISDVNIIGNKSVDSVGMLIEGYDNTFTNMRIGYVHKGVVMKSAGNSLTNIHPLYQIGWDKFSGSCGFVEEGNNNLYTYCYSDQFETGYKIVGNGRSLFDNCFCMWWSGEGKTAVGFKSEGKQFNCVVTNMRIDFRGDTENTVYDGPVAGNGRFENLMIDTGKINTNIKYKRFESNSFVFRLRSFFSKIVDFFKFVPSIFGIRF